MHTNAENGQESAGSSVQARFDVGYRSSYMASIDEIGRAHV